MWIRDWADGLNMDVRIVNETYTNGAINVTGPLATALLTRAGMSEPLKFMRFADMQIAGIPCRVFRLSFTGEASYELHHPAEYSHELWSTLMALGADLGIRPHGLEALTLLRLEKGHVIVGQDTDYDSTPRRIHHEWMCKLDKEQFLGRASVIRTNRIELDKMLVGFEIEEGAPREGAVIWHGDDFAGHVTSAGWSFALNKGLALGWLDYFDGNLPQTVTISGMTARRVDLPFYDKEAARARA
jgi:sarcosine oxidase, subunit alpha